MSTLVDQARSHVNTWESPKPVHHTMWANDAADLLRQLADRVQELEGKGEPDAWLHKYRRTWGGETYEMADLADPKSPPLPRENFKWIGADPLFLHPPAAQDREAVRAELLNTPELHNFAEGVTLEALHQRDRWGADHDAGKAPADWFWLVGYLAGKALAAHTSGNVEKALHHTISTSAALANWHAAITGEHTAMRPGIDPAAHGIKEPQR